MMTEHDMNRLESVTSQEIQNVMEKTLDFKIRNNELSEKEKSSSLMFARLSLPLKLVVVMNWGARFRSPSTSERHQKPV